MAGEKNKMQFTHNYFTQDQMNKGGEGAFSSKFKSYITDGPEALKDKVYQTGLQSNREQVMRDIRAGLRQRMFENNRDSAEAAKQLMKDHKALHKSMEDALKKAKIATRQKKLLKAQLLAEKSRQSNDNARNSVAELGEMISSAEQELDEDRALLQEKQMQELQAGENPGQDVNGGRMLHRIRRSEGQPGQVLRQTKTLDDVSEKNVQQREIDLQYLQRLKNYSQDNVDLAHSKNLASLFRAISKKAERSRLEKDIENQEGIIREQNRVLKDKTKAWNEKRKKDYESGSFRKYYDDYDKAVLAYRALNRKGSDTAPVPQKNIVEYVGEFDVEKLDVTLEKLQDNPYLNAAVEIKNKKAGRGITDGELLKSHVKITAVSEKDEFGRRKRYKLNNEFKGYEAARQFKADEPTALTDRRRAVDKTLQGPANLKLKTDQKDKGGKYINSEENLEIIQAKTKMLFFGKKVNGVYLNGEFLSADRSIIKGDKDSYTIGAFNTWGYTKQKEKVRKAVLKADIFRLINVKTIQAAAGYEAASSTGINKIKEKMITDIVNKDKLSKQEAEALFNDAFENKIFHGENKHRIENDKEAEWERILFGNDEAAKKKLSDAIKVKVAHDVIRQEVLADKNSAKNIVKKTTRIGKAFDVISKDPKSVMELSLFLLSNDEHPEFWDLAKVICTEHMPYSFGMHMTTQKTGSTFKRAVDKYSNGAKNGQLMRMALIDELTTQRKNIDFADFFGALMPTSWKQYNEELAAKRGIGAILKRKATDGTILGFVGDLFDSVTNTGKDLKLFSDDVNDKMNVMNIYMGAVTSAVNIGAIANASAYAVGEAFGDEVTEKKDEKSGKTIQLHSQETRRYTIGFVFLMIKNLCSIIKSVQKWSKTRKDEIKKKQSKNPNYDPKSDLSATDSTAYRVIFDLMTLAATMGVDCSKYVNNPLTKDVFNTIKHTLSMIESSIASGKARLQKNRIQEAEEDFETLMTKDNKTPDERDMVDVLRQNSQLQYGLALAKRKNADEQKTKALKAVKSAGKGAISFAKAVVPGKMSDLFPPFVLIDSAWTVLTTVAEIGLEGYLHKKNVRFNTGKMLGKKFENVNLTVLNKVLKRETGITSADYLPDLARIFMAINTHVFMKKATTKAEKNVGSKVAKTLFNNDVYSPENLKKMQFKDLLGVLGVDGNFHKILKYSLA